jgi:CheY-like chemotaxis protein
MIVIVDDEKRYIDQYILELVLSGYNDKVRLETKVDAAMRYIEENLSRVELLVLDIMMPPGEESDNDVTQSGLRTGVDFFDRVRRLSADLPVIILTNVGDPGLATRFEQEKKCWFMRKTDYLPYQFAHEVQQIVPLPVTN